jgi:hypothetical protein
MEKNVAGKWIVFAYGLPDHANDGQPITGDAANITANIRIDGGAANAVDDVNPTELEDGYYVFDITAAEANGDLLSLHPVSATANVQVIGVPGAVWTRPANFNAFGIESDGDVSVVNLLTGHTAQTGDSYAYLGTNLGAAGANATEAGGTGDHLNAIPWNATWDAQVESEVTDALNAYDPPTNAEMVARTLLAADYFDPATDTVADATAINGDATAAANLEAMYNGSGYIADTAPASRAQVESSTAASAAVSTVPLSAPDGFVITSGLNEVNDEDSVVALDGVVHSVEDNAGTTDVYYVFNVGGNGVPTSVTWNGYVQTVGDSWQFYAYNWAMTAWEMVGSRAGGTATTVEEQQFSLTTAHVGTGANLGDVRFRLYSTDGTLAATDRILCSYAVVAESVGYSEGAIWVSSTGTAGSEVYVNGTADNPCPWANALTLNGTLGLNRFHIANGDTVTLSAAADNYSFFGDGYTVNLGSQSISGAVFENATITGDDDGSNAVAATFRHCEFTDTSLGLHRMFSCAIGGTTTGITLTEAGTYFWDQCYSGVAGTDTPLLTYSAGTMGVNLRHWSGGIQIENMGVTASSHTMSVEGFGQVKEGTCTQGTVAIRGNFTVSGFTNLTLSDDARIDVAQVNAQVLDVITVDTFPEVTSVPAATSTLLDKVNWVFALSRNKLTQDATTQTLRNDADGADIATATVQDTGAVFTRNEFS